MNRAGGRDSLGKTGGKVRGLGAAGALAADIEAGGGTQRGVDEAGKRAGLDQGTDHGDDRAAIEVDMLLGGRIVGNHDEHRRLGQLAQRMAKGDADRIVAADDNAWGELAAQAFGLFIRCGDGGDVLRAQPSHQTIATNSVGVGHEN